MHPNVPAQMGLEFESHAQAPIERLRAATEHLSAGEMGALAEIAERLGRRRTGSAPALEAAGAADPLAEAREQILELACDACASLGRLPRGDS